MSARKRGFWLAFLHHLSASTAGARSSVTLNLSGAGGQHLDFVGRLHVTAARFLGNSKCVFNNFPPPFLSGIEAAAA